MEESQVDKNIKIYRAMDNMETIVLEYINNNVEDTSVDSNKAVQDLNTLKSFIMEKMRSDGQI